MIHNYQTPHQLGYRFPAEWEKHDATWLSYPHNENSWPDKMHTIFPFYHLFIKELAKNEKVHINVCDEDMQKQVTKALTALDVKIDHVFFHLFPTNDAWCRDHGPAFLINPNAEHKKIIVSWKYNAWGGKYPHELDDKIPLLVADYLKIPHFDAGIVMEGGSVDFNGQGTVLTTKACLLNPNRNPQLSQAQIEQKLYDFYGVEHIVWLGDGIDGDDTDGHIDDITRFVNDDTVITVVESNKQDANYVPLQENLQILKKARLQNGKQMNIVEIPMPKPVIWEEQRLPASYANLYIANESVIVPLYNCKEDNKAVYLLEECFPNHKITGIDSSEIIWGLGSFHCLSQQEPSV